MSKKQRRRIQFAARCAARARQRRRRVVSTALGLMLLGAVTSLVAAPADIYTSPGAIAEGKPPDALEIGAGDGTVSGKTGAYTYSIPISVPPGRLGVQPSLALTYSSQQPLRGGIAAGWSLDLPTISRDWSRGQYASERWTSSMAGRELVETTGVEIDLPAGWRSFRAQSDSSQARYQLIPSQVTGAYTWTVLQTDGTILYFGEPSYMGGFHFDDWMPLTRRIDSFGNEVHYNWEPVWHGSTPLQLVGFRPGSIEYTINDGVGLDAHAKVSFDWAAPDLCGTEGFPIGAKMSYRSGLRRISGSSRLETITTQVANGTGGFRDVRRYELGYNANPCPASGTASESPLRLLETVTERAWSPPNDQGQSIETTMPTISFDYGNTPVPELASFEGLGTLMPLAAGTLDSLDPLGDTAETLMLDMDGDSLVDIVYAVPTPVGESACHIAWRKNLGINSSGNVAFGGENLVEMPTLPWENQPSETELGTMGPGESCSLAGQHTLTWDPWKPEKQEPGWFAPPSGYVGAILIYSYRDVNGDGLIDVVTAVERDSNYYAPIGFAGPLSCGLMATGAGPWPTVGELAPEDQDPLGINPPAPQQTLVPFETGCVDEYPWNVHLGNGADFDDVSPGFNQGNRPSVYVRAPIPLSKQVGEGRPIPLTQGISGQPNHFGDVDGDGLPDFLRMHDNPLTGAPWVAEVFLWNGEADDLEHPLTPIVWAERSQYGGSQEAPIYPQSSAQCDDSPCGAPLDHIYTSQYSHVADLNGDGLSDIVHRDPFETGARVFWNVGGSSGGVPGFFEGPLSSFELISLTDFHEFSSFRTPLSGFRDLDADGLPDRFEPSGSQSVPQFGIGEGFVAGALEEQLGQATKLVGAQWFVFRDWIDVTGDGIPDKIERPAPTHDSVELSIANSAGERRGVLKSIDNGRGLVVEVAYAPHTDASVVTMGTGKLPSPTWVVKSVTATHSHGSPSPEPATTSVAYDTPVWNQDPDGRWGFRGFEVVVTTGPSGARTEERYSYTADWSGRPTSTLTYASGSANPATITDTIWQRLRHSGWHDWNCTSCTTEEEAGPIVDFYFPQRRSSYRCEMLDNGVVTTYDEGSCRAQTAQHVALEGYTELVSNGIGFAFVKDREVSGELTGSTTATGFVKTISHEHLYSSSIYRIVEEISISGEGTGSWFSACQANEDTLLCGWSETLSSFGGYSQNFWNTDRTLLEQTCSARGPGDLLGSVVDPSSAPCTAYTYDADTGLKLTEQRPEMYRLENYPDPGETSTHLVTTFDYSGTSFPQDGKWDFPEASFKVVPVTVTNELGHVVHTHTDLGTGAVLASYGPNPNEGSYQEVDGFGRVLETWVSTDEAGPSDPYLWLRTGITEYQDLASPQQRIERSSRNPKDASWYTTKYNDTYWAEHRTVYDGAGRVIESIDWDISAAEPDTTRRFAYDSTGNLDFATVPDPSVSDDAVRVTYDFTYDSLGRRTCATTPDGTGVATIFGGFQTEVTELVPDGAGGGTCANPATTAPGPRATRTLTKDVFDRVIQVAEATTSGPDAVTTYEYDANSNVSKIVRQDDDDPSKGIEDIVTEMVHDWIGNRRSITRDPGPSARTWTYEYDLDGNLESQTAPGGSPAFTTTYIYDALGRMESKTPGSGVVGGQTELAIGATEFNYDAGLDGIGRLTSVTLPFGSVSLGYDAWGNLTSETRSVDLSSALGVTFADSLSVTFSGHTSDGKPMKEVQASGTTTYYSYAFVGWKPLWVKAYHELSGFATSASTQFTRSYNAAALPKSNTLYLRDAGQTLHAGRAVYISRDQNGRVIQEYSNDPSSGDDQINQSYTFTGAGEVATLFSRIGGSTDYRSFTFGYDDQHQLVDAGDNRGYDAQFSYWRQGRLKSAFVEATPGTNTLVYPRDVEYIYDSDDPEAVGALNNVGTTTTFEAAFGHDVNGNLTDRTIGGDTSSLKYDGEDRLRVRVAPDGSEELYYYHDNARWLAVKRDPASAGGTILSARLWFGNTEVQYECIGGVCSRDKTRSTLRLGGQTMARFERDVTTGAQTERLLHTSALGHLLGVYRYQDGAGNLDYNLEVGYQYGPFGEVLEVTEFPGASTSAGDYTERFNGKELDEASGLSYYGYRYFDPVSLTWNRADPLYRFAPDRRLSSPRLGALYSFSGNNAVRYVDPDGRDPRPGGDSQVILAKVATTVRYAGRDRLDGNPFSNAQVAVIHIVARLYGAKPRGQRFAVTDIPERKNLDGKKIQPLATTQALRRGGSKVTYDRSLLEDLEAPEKQLETAATVYHEGDHVDQNSALGPVQAPEGTIEFNIDYTLRELEAQNNEFDFLKEHGASEDRLKAAAKSIENLHKRLRKLDDQRFVSDREKEQSHQ